MSELERSLTEAAMKDITPEAAPAAVETPEVTPEPATEIGKQPENSASPQEILDWRKDPRYGKMWNKGNKVQFSEDQHKVINDEFYKSYRNIEKVWEPTKKELETLKKDKEAMTALAKEYGISIEKLKDVLEEHKTFKDPDNPVISRGNYLSAWFDNEKLAPLYKDKVTNFFKGLETEEMQRQYPGMNDVQIKEMVELKQKVQAIEAQKKEEARTTSIKEQQSLIDKNINRGKEYAKAKGFEITVDMENKLIDFCKENKVFPKDVFYAFREMFDEQIDKVYSEKVKAGTLQNLDKNKNSVVLKPGEQAKPVNAGGGTLLEKLSRAAGLTT